MRFYLACAALAFTGCAEIRSAEHEAPHDLSTGGAVLALDAGCDACGWAPSDGASTDDLTAPSTADLAPARASAGDGGVIDDGSTHPASSDGATPPAAADGGTSVACSGSPMSAAEASARLGGHARVALAGYRVVGLSRDCYGHSCADWAPYALEYSTNNGSVTRTISGGTATLMRNGSDVTLELDDSNSCGSDPTQAYGASCASVTQAGVGCNGYTFPDYHTVAACNTYVATLGSSYLRAGGLVTNHCLTLTATGTDVYSSHSWTEYQAVITAYY